MLPRLPGLKIAIFCRRIILSNETFVPLGGKGRGEANRGFCGTKELQGGRQKK